MFRLLILEGQQSPVNNQQTIREIYQRAKYIPVVFLTNYTACLQEFKSIIKVLLQLKVDPLPVHIHLQAAILGQLDNWGE